MKIRDIPPSDSGKKEKMSLPSPARAATVGAGPPNTIVAATGIYMTVKNIIVP